MKKMIATDLDGTLFFPKARFRLIRPKALKFIRSFIDEGGEFVVVSGRNEFFGQKVQKKIARPIGIIGCNGSFIMQNNKKIFENYFNNEKLKNLLSDIEKIYRPMCIFIMTKKYNMICHPTRKFGLYAASYLLYYFLQGAYREPTCFSQKAYFDELNTGKTYKVLIMFGVTNKAKIKAKEINKALRSKYHDEFEFSYAGQGIEISPSNCSKAEGLKNYINYFKINHDNVYVIGDSGNDISMFHEFYENSFCMAHAPIFVSKYANHIVNNFIEIEKYIKKEGK